MPICSPIPFPPTINIAGVVFSYGENPQQRWYETRQQETQYLILQPKTGWWWTIIAERGDRLRPLNTATWKDGVLLEAGPLYSHHEKPLTEWLNDVAWLIRQGCDPWHL